MSGECVMKLSGVSLIPDGTRECLAQAVYDFFIKWTVEES